MVKKKGYFVRLSPEVVDRLRKAALKVAFERGKQCSWAQLVREGAELVLEKHADTMPAGMPEVTW